MQQRLSARGSSSDAQPPQYPHAYVCSAWPSCSHSASRLLQFGAVYPQFLGDPLGFLGADEGLQRRFALGDGIFQAVDLRLEFVDTILHLLALDGIQALGRGVLGFRRLAVDIAIRGLRICR